MTTLNPLKLTCFGAALEYYDFTIFALLAPFISQIFFPKTTPYLADIAAFTIFALGYFFRPLGGIIFGVIGDRFGRKTTFTISILLMAFATLSMGLMPTHEQIGITAPLLFTLLRIIQGVSYGAELPGSLTFLVEHSSTKLLYITTSIMVACITLGSASSAFVVFICNKVFSIAQMQVWGWRIPFLIGGSLAIIGFLIRKKTVETPYFLNEGVKPSFALTNLLRQNWSAVITGIGLILLPASCIIFYLSLPTFLQRAFHYQAGEIYLAMMVGNLWTIILLPCFGWLYDKCNKKVILGITTILYILCSYPLFHLLTYQTTIALYSFTMLYQTLLAALAAGYFTMLAANFPTSIRFTGTALCYNLALVAAATTPVITLTLWQVTANPLSPAWLFIVLALVMLLSVLYSRNNLQPPLK